MTLKSFSLITFGIIAALAGTIAGVKLHKATENKNIVLVVSVRGIESRITIDMIRDIIIDPAKTQLEESGYHITQIINPHELANSYGIYDKYTLAKALQTHNSDREDARVLCLEAVFMPALQENSLAVELVAGELNFSDLQKSKRNNYQAQITVSWENILKPESSDESYLMETVIKKTKTSVNLFKEQFRKRHTGEVHHKKRRIIL